VQNKISEGLASARSVLSGDSLTERQLLHLGEHICLCQRANGQVLVAAVVRILAQDEYLSKMIARHEHTLFLDQFKFEQKITGIDIGIISRNY
jgi:hypothetical protein